jgi:DNA repair protein RadD
MKLTPRPYQIAAVKAASASVRSGKSPLIVLPGGTGKALCVAMMSNQIVRHGKRVLNLTHDRGLVGQNHAELLTYEPLIDAGIYSAGLSRKDTGHAAMFAGIQSYVNHAYDSGRFDYILIDEAHRVPPGDQGQYQKVFEVERKKNPDIRIIGLTATPFRMGQGSLIEGDDRLFDEICYEAFYLDMVRDGYLSMVTAQIGKGSADLIGVHIRRGEYVESEAEEAFMAVLPSQVSAIIEAGKNRKKWLIFATSVRHAEALQQALNEHVKTGIVVGGDEKNRDKTINTFKHDDMRACVNVNIMTTGTNVPAIDMLVLCRATHSTSLYVQMIYRGTRLSPGKKDCRVLDFGQNTLRHGPIDTASQSRSGGGGKEPLGRQCPECDTVSPIGSAVCIACGFVFPKPQRKVGKNLKESAGEGGITSIEPIKLYVDDVGFKADVTSNGNDCIIMNFIQNGERWPVHREWLMLWHDNEWVHRMAWRKLNAITNGQAEELKGLDRNVIETVLNEAYQSKEIPRIDFVNLLPNKKEKKYFDLIAWGQNEPA